MSYNKIDPEFKVKWLKALRGGRYRQGKGNLREKDSKGYCYCCLGVAGNLVNPKKWAKDPGRTVTTYSYENYNAGFLPNPVANKIGLVHHIQKDLAKLNDEKKNTFKEVADWIEKNL